MTDKLKTILTKRLVTQVNLHETLKEIITIKEIIEKRKLDVKTSFNAKIDKNDTRYSNAEKRRVELENELKNDTLLQQDTEELKALETKLAQFELNDKIEKLQERYLFKRIDLHIAEIDIKKEQEYLKETMYEQMCDKCVKNVD